MTQTCKYCGNKSNSLPILTDIDSLPSSSEDLLTIAEAFDTEITRLEMLLNRLVLNRSLLKRKINYHSSPLLRIPSDITSEIFKAYLHEKGETEGRETRHGEDSLRLASGTPNMPRPSLPLLLGSVCKVWRELAWSMPRMWSSISLTFDHPSPHSAILLDEWFSRSGQRPLNISLNISFKSGSLNRKQEYTVQEVIGIIVRFSGRWRHIDFDLPSEYYNAFRSVKAHIPLLESVSLRLLGPIDPLEPLQTFSVAPHLRAVHCENFPPQSVQFPFAQLTSFSGYWECEAGDCLNVLQEASQLTHARFRQRPLGWGWGPHGIVLTPHQVLAPRLQSLRLDCNNSDSLINTLLDNLTLPDVRELSLSATEIWDVLDFGHLNFVSFIRRSACPLESLSLSGLHLTDDAFLRCMQVIPSLTELKIGLPGGVTDHTISNLDPHTTPNLLPKLKMLSLSSSNLVIDFIELHRMLSARWNADGLGHRLESAIISGTRIVEGTHSPMIPLLEELTAEGMKISVDTESDRSWADGWGVG